jgi:CheY-like chemotaxis protein
MQVEHKIFTIQVLGFSPVEKTMIAGVCKLSKTRLSVFNQQQLTSFNVLEANTSDIPDVLLINMDNASVKQTFESNLLPQNVPVIFISKTSFPNLKDNQFLLVGSSVGGMLKTLLETLDRIALKLIEKLTQKKTCLVIDDSELARMQIGLILNQYPVTVKYAGDAESALVLTKAEVFDVIFLDVMLPNMDGYKACQILKADSHTKTTPVVMLTSKSSPFNKMYGAYVGCDRYLTKPVDADQVYQVLKQYALI